MQESSFLRKIGDENTIIESVDYSIKHIHSTYQNLSR